MAELLIILFIFTLFSIVFYFNFVKEETPKQPELPIHMKQRLKRNANKKFSRKHH